MTGGSHANTTCRATGAGRRSPVAGRRRTVAVNIKSHDAPVGAAGKDLD